MRALLPVVRLLGQDLLATLLFSGLVVATGNIALSVGAGLAIGVAQLAYDLTKRRPIEALQWTSLATVVVAGGAALLAHDARILLVKPTVIYAAIALSMLKRGWMNRYLPGEAKALVPDLGIGFGYAWAGMMAATALFNLALLATVDIKTWGLVMAIVPIASKAVLGLGQYAVMRNVAMRRYRSDPVAGAALLAAA